MIYRDNEFNQYFACIILSFLFLFPVLIGWVTTYVRYHFLMYATRCWIPVCPSQYWIMKNLEILKYSRTSILFLVILLTTTFLKAVAFLQLWLQLQLMIQGNLTIANHLLDVYICTHIIDMHLATVSCFKEVDVINCYSFSGLEFGKVLSG